MGKIVEENDYVINGFNDVTKVNNYLEIILDYQRNCHGKIYYYNSGYISSKDIDEYSVSRGEEVSNRRVLVNGGPGTGKSYNLVEIVSYYIDKGIEPSAICILSLTNATKDELYNRFEKKGIVGIKISTIDAFCRKIVREINEHKSLFSRLNIEEVSLGSDNHDEIVNYVKNFFCQLDPNGIEYGHKLFESTSVFDDFKSIKVFMIDELQDITGVKADFIIELINLCNNSWKVSNRNSYQIGFYLFGDVCQSIFDFETRSDDSELEAMKNTDTSKFYNSILSMEIKFSIYELQKEMRGFSSIIDVSSLRESILDIYNPDNNDVYRFDTLKSKSEEIERIIPAGNNDIIKQDFISGSKLCFITRRNDKLISIADTLCEKQIKFGICIAKDRSIGLNNNMLVYPGEIKPITIANIHNAKGRECDIVVIDSEWWNSKTSDKELERAKYLYVAATRAKNKLVKMSCDEFVSLVAELKEYNNTRSEYQMKSNRHNDSHAEQVLGSLLDNVFYNKVKKLIQERLSANSIEWKRVSDKELQYKGIDGIIKIDDKELVIDEKAALDYLTQELNTFAFEISYLNDFNDEVPGWYVKEGLDTDYYLLVWPRSQNNDLKYLRQEDFTSAEIAFINKKILIEKINKKVDGSHLFEYAKQMRYIYSMSEKKEYDTINNVFLVYSGQKSEKSINYLVSKQELLQIAEIYAVYDGETTEFVKFELG